MHLSASTARPLAALITLAALRTAVGAPPGVTYVDANLATGANDGTSWANAYRGSLGLKSALDAGATTIWLADGVYYPGPVGSPATTTFTLHDEVKVIGGFAGGEVEVSDADPSVNIATLTGDLPGGPVGKPELEAIVTFVNGTWNSHLIGVTLDVCLAGPTASGVGGPRRGLVINGGSAYVENCVVRNGRATKGGGVLVNDATLDMFGCTIASNVGELAGGGVFSDRTSETYLNESLVAYNVGGLGAGVYFGAFGSESAGGAFPGLHACTFVDNVGLIGAASGGGVYCKRAVIEIDECTFLRCIVPGGGGGMFSESSNVELFRCRFIGCSAAGDGGGGIYCNSDGSAGDQTLEMANCLFNGNHNAIFARNGAGVLADSCTIVQSKALPGQPLFFPTILATGPQPSSILLTNSILWHNTPLSGAAVGGNVLALGGSTISFKRCDLQGWSGPSGGITSTATLTVDPLFKDRLGLDGLAGTADDDLRLSLASPCIDTGDELALAFDQSYDLNGEDRYNDILSVTNTGVGFYGYLDVGCHERGPADCPTDLSGDGATDAADLAILLGHWGDEWGSADLDGDELVGASDLAILLGGFGVPCT